MKILKQHHVEINSKIQNLTNSFDINFCKILMAVSEDNSYKVYRSMIALLYNQFIWVKSDINIK